MSNPISTLPNATELEEDRPELEVDDLDIASETELEVDAPEDAPERKTSPAEIETADEDDKPSRGGSGLLILVLTGLLLGSVAINLKQSRDVANLEARSSEYEQALAAAVERKPPSTASTAPSTSSTSACSASRTRSTGSAKRLFVREGAGLALEAPCLAAPLAARRSPLGKSPTRG